MSAPTRRLVLHGLLASAGVAALRLAAAQATSSTQTVAITARRFAYEPNEITLRAGVPVVVEIRSLDFLHGMNLPSMGRRLDLIPGRVTRLEFTPGEPGTIDFLCDNFCGEGHETMSGKFFVVA